MDGRYLTVSQFTDILKNLLEETFFDTIYLRGEISGFKPASTGHWYFSLKDNEALIKAIVFKYSQSDIIKEFAKSGMSQIKDGIEVLVQGKISVYKKGGEYSIIVNKMSPVGEGLLYVKFEELKKKLQKKGYFDENIKKKLPERPKVIGIVTSPTGAALQDMINILNRRAKDILIKVFSVSVQGDQAKFDIVKAIKYADYQFRINGKDKVDVLILARGGGSIEDLWAFNEEIVADAIYNAEVPIISAIGHQVDFTISDFCADLRAPTPSGAAEIVAKSSSEILDRISSLENSIQNRFSFIFQNYKKRYELFTKDRIDRYFFNIYEEYVQNVTYSTEKIDIFFKKKIENVKYIFENTKSKIDTLNPKNIMKMGYSVIEKDNKMVKSIDNLKKDDKVKIIMIDGEKYGNIL